MNISHVTDFIGARYEGKKITPAKIEQNIRAVVEALDIFEEPEGMKIRFSIGTPIPPEEIKVDDWKEQMCVPLAELPDDLKNKEYTVYEIWYDGDPDYEELCGVEVMLYEE